MRKEQIWCDNPTCGREIQLKHWPKGSMSIDHNETDKSWEVWVPRNDDQEDRVYCCLECLVLDMAALLHATKNAEVN